MNAGFYRPPGIADLGIVFFRGCYKIPHANRFSNSRIMLI
jgi:hypothetical protein